MHKNIKKAFSLLLLFPALSGSVMSQSNAVKATITLHNPSDLERTGEVVSVSWAGITAKYPGIDTANFKVLDATKKELPFQLERLGTTTVQNLLIQVSLKPKSSSKLTIIGGKPMAVIPKTYGRYVPERYDDFTWENDKIAFRMYGKALEVRKDNAYGMDVWVKRTPKMVINDWYKSGDYHTDHGDGMDYYSVGFTLGGGDIAPYVGDSVFFSKNYHHWKVLDNGPLRTTFELGYDEWDVAGKAVKVVKTISLDAGSLMNKVTAVYTYAGNTDLQLVTGIVKRKDPGTIWMDERQGIVGYWEPQHGADGTTGVATIVASPVVKMGTDKKHLLTHLVAKSNQPVVYYNGAAWDRAREITSAQQWFTYLTQFKAKLAQSIAVGVQ